MGNLRPKWVQPKYSMFARSTRVVIERLLSKYVLHSLQNAGAKIAQFFETTKKTDEMFV